MVGQAIDPVAGTVDDIEYAGIRSVLSIVLFTRRGFLNKNQHIRRADLPKVEQGGNVLGDVVERALVSSFETFCIPMSRRARNDYLIKIVEDTSKEDVHLCPLSDVLTAVQVTGEIDSTSSD
jgi:hypothetical protein